MSELTNERISIRLTQQASKAVKKGHPWVFQNSITKQNKEGASGCFAVLYDNKRDFVGIGLYDPDSPIRVRVLHRGNPIPIDENWLEQIIDNAIKIRGSLIADPQTTGYRIINGENDGMGGLVADIYDTTLVIKIYTAVWFPYFDMIKDFLVNKLDAKRVILRLSNNLSDSPLLPAGFKDGAVIQGAHPSGPVIFLENGLKIEADVIKGQKTGFFLDQRENRARVAKLAADLDVLNVFSYNGGFSLQAARGGAKSVTDIDISSHALDASERLFKLNSADKNVANAEHECLLGDAFKVMQQLVDEKKRYCVVIVDPPSFAKKQADVPQALKAYEKLAIMAAKLVENHGYLVFASCSSRVTSDDFFETVRRGIKKTGRRLEEFDRTFHAQDHPVTFEEGKYLKCLYGKIK